MKDNEAFSISSLESRVVDTMNRSNPDLVVTGPQEKEKKASRVKELTSPLYTRYFYMGNVN